MWNPTETSFRFIQDDTLSLETGWDPSGGGGACCGGCATGQCCEGGGDMCGEQDGPVFLGSIAESQPTDFMTTQWDAGSMEWTALSQGLEWGTDGGQGLAGGGSGLASEQLAVPVDWLGGLTNLDAQLPPAGSADSSAMPFLAEPPQGSGGSGTTKPLTDYELRLWKAGIGGAALLPGDPLSAVVWVIGHLLADPPGGPPPAAKPGKCGPDVTEWFRRDLKRHHAAIMAANRQLRDRGDLFDDWFARVKYKLSYKWMDFRIPGCGTDRCKHTVMLAGVCIRKNQLGNIAFGLLANTTAAKLRDKRGWKSQFGRGPAVGLGYMVSDSLVEAAYLRVAGYYDQQHPYSSNYGPWQGHFRYDNLAAFSVGRYLADNMDLKPLDNAGFFETLMSVVLADDKSFRDYEYIHVHRKKHKKRIGRSEFTWVPEHGGFDTTKCEPCGKKWTKKASTETALDRMMTRYRREIGTDLESIADFDDWMEGLREDEIRAFDQWLKKTYENYAR